MDESLLDSDILSEILKSKNERVVAAANDYVAQYARFTFSAISSYEIVRGFKATGARRGLTKFKYLAEKSVVLPVTDDVLMRATDLWAVAVRGGHPRSDADLIIAATALEAGLGLVTGNTAHFDWVPGLSVVNWRL
jgi:tRNA(fMet)-specific endonuclease VapC